MKVTELTREAFDNAMSYASQIIGDLENFAVCENQEVFFEEFFMENGVEFNKNGTPGFLIPLIA